MQFCDLVGSGRLVDSGRFRFLSGTDQGGGWVSKVLGRWVATWDLWINRASDDFLSK